jgi:hemoglobin-like flavoprotein
MNIEDSLDLILRSKDMLGEAFYKSFFEKHPQVQEYFRDVNLQRQAILVTMSLGVVEQYYSNPYQATERYIQYLGAKHHERKIPQALFPLWADTMLETLEKFHGDDWDDHLRQQWQEAIERTTETMFQGYERQYSV